MAEPARRLLWPLIAMLLLSGALQAASLMAMTEIDSSVAQNRHLVIVATSQRATVGQFQNVTYLALVGLASADWELLLRQRAAAQELTEQFGAANTAMLEGGRVLQGDLEVTVAAVKNPEIRAALTAVRAQWEQMHASHVRVLRSDNRSLKQNPDLEQFHAVSQQLRIALTHLTALVQGHAQAEMRELSRIQRLVPIGTFLVTLALFAFVFVRILLPFAASMEVLALNELELRRARDELEQRVAERTVQLAEANESLRHAHDGLEVRVRDRTQELKDAQRHAVELARQAGMAELATNVLHNVGNVLTSITTSTSLLDERLRALRVDSLVKLAGVLGEHRADLAHFFTSDDRGRRLPEFLEKLGRQLSVERGELVELTGTLLRHVDHVRMIVELQQTYVTSSSLIEATSLEEMVDDALRISGAALGRHGVTLERQLIPLPRLMIDKHKLLQILLNLVSNAKYALDTKPPGERLLAIRVDRPTEATVRVRVSDNGMGIAPELLTKIFQHGFTTRKEGHGFGLHSSALAAQALGGSLQVHSDGPGQGATFSLELPFRSEELGLAQTGS